VTLRLGLRYDPAAAPVATDAGVAAARLHRSVVAHVCAAEARGVDVVWLSERPFAGGAPLPAAFPVAAAVAAATSRVRIGVGPLALALHHPLRVAEDAASVDGLSAGRLELGLGLGENERAFDAFAVATAERVARFEEGVALLRAAFEEGPIDLAGRFCDARGLDVQPKPVQPGGPPLWLAADSAAAAARAGRIGDGLLCRDPGLVAIFAAAWTGAGRRPEALRVSLELAAHGAVDAVRAAAPLLSELPHLDLVLPALPAGAAAEVAFEALDALAAALPEGLRARRARAGPR